ncbi:trans-sialidase [Trypanosoma cruzi]|nr:trans-sialidase [Trypanosoma cruzi]
MVSVRLTEQLQRVKEVLKTWKDVDSRVSQLCTNSLAQKAPSTDNVCSTAMPTAGLVGFLSGNFSDNTWRDEYLGVNATVKNGAAAKAKTSDGVTFHGAWAEWPVGKQGENQLYHFANYNFTLVATVSIDKVPEEGDTPIPVMGATMKGEQGKFFGLSYEKERKWMLLCGDGTTNSGELSSIGEPGTKRHVVILLRNGNQSSAYFDGQRVGNEQCALENAESKGISHFYIGGDGGSAEDKEGRKDVPVTVTNVLLYNRPLSDNEIAAFNPNKVDIQQLKDKSSEPSVSSDSVDTNASPVTAAAQQTGTSSTPDGKHPTEQRQLMGSSNAGSSGASTTAVSTITTPAAGEESVMQVASGSSSDGHKNVGGGSFSDGDPTVETRGGTNGQEEVNTQVREVNATALNSSLVNVSQGNNSDGSSPLPRILLASLLLLGLWWFAAL